MNNKHYIGRAVNSLEHYDKVGPITGVSILVDENNEYVAGDMTGYVFETTCPYGTQAMANAMLASLQGKVYKGFRATDAILDKDAELGDGITIDGEYAMLAYQEITFGPKHTSEIAAPGESILEHEYPYVGSTQKTINRKIAQVNSKITKTSEEIRLEVSNELENLSSSIDVKLGSITSTVQGLDGRVTTVEQTATGLTSTVQGLDSSVSSIEQKVDSIKIGVTTKDGVSTIKLTGTGITASSAKIDLSGFVTFTGLSGGTTTIDGSCIKTGTISADRINLTGAITFGDLDTDAQNTINGISKTASNAMSKATSAYNLANSIDIPNYIKSTYIGHTIIKSPTIKGNNMEVYGAYKVLDASDRTMGYMGAATGMDATGGITTGVALASSATLSGSGEDGITYATTGNYVIATSGGCRMQAGNDSIVVTSDSAELNYGNGSYRVRVSNNGCQYYDGSWHNIGSGSGSSIPVWG